MTVHNRYGHISAECEKRQRRYKATTKIVEWLGSGDFDSLLNAKELLERMDGQSTEILRRIVRSEITQRKKYRRELKVGLFMLALLLLNLLIFNRIMPGSFFTLAPCLLMPTWLFMPFLIAWAERQYTSTRRLRNAVTLLSRNYSVDAVGELIEAMNRGDTRTRSLATDALTVILPHVTAEHGALLTEKHRAMLYQELYDYNSNLILSILTALERIGDRRAIPSVEKLVQCPVWFAQSDKIQASAKQCLSHLKALSEERRDMQTLLRCSSAVSIPIVELLRPADFNEDPEPEQLLRACHVQEKIPDG